MPGTICRNKPLVLRPVKRLGDTMTCRFPAERVRRYCRAILRLKSKQMIRKKFFAKPRT